jgi:hypothetical protein
MFLIMTSYENQGYDTPYTEAGKTDVAATILTAAAKVRISPWSFRSHEPFLFVVRRDVEEHERFGQDSPAICRVCYHRLLFQQNGSGKYGYRLSARTNLSSAQACKEGNYVVAEYMSRMIMGESLF